MKYGHAVLGESLELYKEAAEWGRDQKRRMEMNETRFEDELVFIIL